MKRWLFSIWLLVIWRLLRKINQYGYKLIVMTGRHDCYIRRYFASRRNLELEAPYYHYPKTPAGDACRADELAWYRK